MFFVNPKSNCFKEETTWIGLSAVAFGLVLAFEGKYEQAITSISAGLIGIFSRNKVDRK